MTRQASQGRKDAVRRLQGMRYKQRKAVQECNDFSYSDWSHGGPATTLHLIKATERQGGDTKNWLEIWCRARA